MVAFIPEHRVLLVILFSVLQLYKYNDDTMIEIFKTVTKVGNVMANIRYFPIYPPTVLTTLASKAPSSILATPAMPWVKFCCRVTTTSLHTK